MSDLIPCPLCGSDLGMVRARLLHGLTECACAACRRPVCICRHGGHIEAWNAAGAHAQSLRERVAALESAVRDIIDIVDTSKGAAGYHLNGDTAEWAYFDWPAGLADVLEQKP